MAVSYRHFKIEIKLGMEFHYNKQAFKVSKTSIVRIVIKDITNITLSVKKPSLNQFVGKISVI